MPASASSPKVALRSARTGGSLIRFFGVDLDVDAPQSVIDEVVAALEHGVPDGVAAAEVRRDVEDLVAQHSPSHVFVHAGVVAQRGGALLVAGRSFSGKSSLVAALVRQGATYFSDEFAPLDESGLVHPYPRPLGLRRNRRELPRPVPVESLGATAGTAPLPVTGVVFARFEPGVRWHPRRLTAGEGMLGLLDNTVVARSAPERSLRVLSRAAGDGTTVIAGDRGDADETAEMLLADERLWGPA